LAVGSVIHVDTLIAETQSTGLCPVASGFDKVVTRDWIFIRRPDVVDNQFSFSKMVGVLLKAMSSLAVLFIIGCGPAKPAMPPPAPSVTVVPVEERTLEDFVVFTGRTEAVESVDIRARVSGYLNETKFKDGQEVKKGDVLFAIDPRPYQADEDRAKAEYDQAQADLQLSGIEYTRASELRKKNAISASDFDAKAAAYLKSQSRLASAKASWDTAKLNLEFTTIKSPIDGKTSRAAITQGNLVTPDLKVPLTVVVSTDPMYAYAEIDERLLMRYVRLNQAAAEAGTLKDEPETPIEMQLADERGFPHLGRIDFADNRVNVETGTITIRGVFENKSRLLGPGLFVRLRFPGGDKYQSLLVPQESIGTDQGQKFVFVVNQEGIVDYRRVEPGALQEDGWRAVKGNLKAGEKVIVDGLIKARVGEKVETSPWEPETATQDETPSAPPEK